ncbi:helix-turn-helix transcriptional regulator [Myxococcota bacterium]|nr:helix-turn-helix transcriptional regulator [Myxococcota bacterium]
MSEVFTGAGIGHGDSEAGGAPEAPEGLLPIEPEALLVLAGAVVSSLREERGWSQQGLAERAGMSQAAVSRVERGLSPLGLADLTRLAATFGLKGSDLVARIEQARAEAERLAFGSAPKVSAARGWWAGLKATAGAAGVAGAVALAASLAVRKAASRGSRR